MKQILVVGIGIVLLITIMAFGITPVTDPLPRIKVALYTGNGTIPKSIDGIKNVLANYEDLVVEDVSAADIVSGGLADYGVLVVPGGSGSGLRKALGSDGSRCIERFVSQGGGYIGICAGAYLPVLGWNDSMKDLELVNAELNDLDHWARGVQIVECAAQTHGVKGEVPFRIHFENGPIFKPGSQAYLPDYISLAKFKTDIHAEGAPEGTMAGYDAVVASRFGRGRVILFSPHPELTPGLENMLAQSLRWSAGQADAQTKALGPDYSWEGIFGVSVLPKLQ